MRLKNFYGFVILLLVPALSFSQSAKIDSLMKRIPLSKTDTALARVYSKLGWIYQNQGMVDSLFKYSRLAYSLSKKGGSSKVLYSSLNQLGTGHSYTGSFDSSLYFYNQALVCARALGDSVAVGGLFNNIGVIYKNHGNIPTALEYYFKSLRYKERGGDEKGIASSYNNIGALYGEMGDIENAIKHYKLALEIYKRHNDRQYICNTYLEIGMYYSSIGRPADAASYVQQAYEISKTLDDIELQAIATYHMAGQRYKEGKTEEAENLYNVALKFSEKLSNTMGMAACFQKLGDIKIKKGQKSEAIELFEKAYNIGKEMDNKELMLETAYKLSNAYGSSGDYKKALELYKQGKSLQDSLYNQDNIRKMMGEQFKYEREKEKLIQQQEEQKKEEARKSEAFRRNFFTGAGIIVLLIVSGFSFVLMRRLAENRKQKNIIELQRNEMIDSINYARRIQFALLAHNDLLQKYLPEHFVLFKPKDIVSGDFYWATSAGSEQKTVSSSGLPTATAGCKFFYLAVCDCTGHGVPGAFMSLLNTSFLNEAINEKNIYEPGEIFNHVRKRLVENISQDGNRDGMDGTLIRFEKENDGTIKLSYSAANNPPLIISGNEIRYQPFDKMPVGMGEKEDLFRTLNITANKGDMLYLFTDGYPDQFGGPKGKKFKYKKLEQQLLQINSLPLQQQSATLEKTFNEWKGDLEQVDDVCIIGIRL
jgi:serine phosphatase RsbU (regulator of sigma subunit)